MRSGQHVTIYHYVIGFLGCLNVVVKRQVTQSQEYKALCKVQISRTAYNTCEPTFFGSFSFANDLRLLQSNLFNSHHVACIIFSASMSWDFFASFQKRWLFRSVVHNAYQRFAIQSQSSTFFFWRRAIHSTSIKQSRLESVIRNQKH